ncbi:MAG: hypothetical protein COV70_04195 [Parcubacteria group bacterium CG11_big_fil_rev_8_21_14_0_20_39_22]|nr:MAG: hypothetical protein COV70_04195 [Parcubacteria group bacterium CG11_big_fil_rev_8_21_14_0_20_39_22]
MVKKRLKRHFVWVKKLVVICLSGLIILSGIFFIWISTLKIPDLQAFEERKVSESTKIYDRTGEVLLYDVHENIKRTVIPYTEISRNIKNATVAIEDDEFWEHNGVKPLAVLRAVLVNIQEGGFSQGGSTITQQVIKNTLLTTDKKIARKLKEWILSFKLERVLSKEEILAIYLNESPYGGNIYGIKEATQAFFNKPASDLTIAESAYLAALPNAPTYYSPHGNNVDKLENRKNLVLKRMLENGFINEEEYEEAKSEVVEFKEQKDTGIKAPHFVVFIRQYLEEKYGKEVIEQAGLKVTTTLDYELQEKAERLVKDFIFENQARFNPDGRPLNGAIVSIDPKTGQILTMVGSRDYFDKELQGNFNVTVAHRQPGSSFKPIAYVTAFEKGYTPETVVFDLQTQFSTACTEGNFTSDGICYSPRNYTGTFQGPVTLRNALAQSLNIPAIKVLHLVGIRDTLQTAKDLGITSLTDPDRYGLALVLGGGEVSLLDLTGAYGVFANDGKKNQTTGILKIEDSKGVVLEEYERKEKEVISEESVRKLTSILSDSEARAPLFSRINHYFEIPGYSTAIKTGTTNNNRDAWIMGYSPTIVVGAWMGNNDNTEMTNAAGANLASLWKSFTEIAIKKTDSEQFIPPKLEKDRELKPILRGIWKGNQTYYIDSFTGGLATQYTPEELKQERVITNVHSILYWVDKDDPRGEIPSNPHLDPQFSRWEYSVRIWAAQNGYRDQTSASIPTQVDTSHNPENRGSITIISPTNNTVYPRNQRVEVEIKNEGQFPLKKAEFYINNIYMGSVENSPFEFSFIPEEIANIKETNSLKVVVWDNAMNQKESSTHFSISER